MGMPMDDEEFLYFQIAASVRRDIYNGIYKTGDTLPSIRSLTNTWQCTNGTAQRAYQRLASEGLVSSHIGKGTRVIGVIPLKQKDTLRQANLINQSEKFLLEMITSSYTSVEVEDAFRVAMDRWRKVSHTQDVSNQQMIRFSGSHDPAVAWMATHFDEISPGFSFLINFSGSLAGLMALSDGKADIAGSHLWDRETESYNIPVLHSLFPGEKLALITLAQRRLGWLITSGNPMNFHSIKDLTNPDIRFVNRHAGSGTRVFLDALLRKNRIDPNSILGYSNQKTNHAEIALEVSEGNADVGMGLESAARAYNLDFIFENLERYDLIVREKVFYSQPIQEMIKWLKNDRYHQILVSLSGYDYQNSGNVIWS
jgi:molybdate-binding protein/DNA-binding transcriptional regulator YhcF (GntR family)